GIFTTLAFGIAWLAALLLYRTGGLTATPSTLAILATGYMCAPAVAHILTRILTREGWQELHLHPNFRQGRLYWFICWVAPAFFTFAGMAVFFALFPQFDDPTFSTVTRLVESSAQVAGQPMPAMDVKWIVLGQTRSALLAAPILNAIPNL